jgi:hypothetical protein
MAKKKQDDVKIGRISKEEFEELMKASEKVRHNAERSIEQTGVARAGYIMMKGVPHVYRNGAYVPMTKVSK